jgi:WD40 repeat protein
MGVLVVVAAFPVSQPACLAQQPRGVPHDGKDVFSVTFSPDGKMIAAGCGDGRIELWEVASHKRRATLRGHAEEVTSVAFSGDGKLLASRGAEATVRLWDMRTGKGGASFTGTGRSFGP